MFKSIQRRITTVLQPRNATKILIAVGLLYFIWIFWVLFSPSTSSDDTSKNSRNKIRHHRQNQQQQEGNDAVPSHPPLHNDIRNGGNVIHHSNNLNSNNNNDKKKEGSANSLEDSSLSPSSKNNHNNNNNNRRMLNLLAKDDAQIRLANFHDDPNTKHLFDNECFTTRYVYAVIPVSSQQDIDDLCNFGAAILQDTGGRTTKRAGARENAGASVDDLLESDIVVNPSEDFVAVVDPSKCLDVDDPLKCGWLHRKIKGKDAIGDSVRGMFPEIKVQLFISASSDQWFAAALAKVSNGNKDSNNNSNGCSIFQTASSTSSNEEPRKRTSSSSSSVTLESVKVVHSGSKDTLDSALSSGLHHALMAARERDHISNKYSSSSSSSSSTSTSTTPPPLAIRAQTHFIASLRPHLIPTSPGLLRILLDTIIRSDEFSSSRPSALNNVPLGMTSRYPCTIHPYANFNAASAAASDILAMKRDASERFFDKIVGASCLGLVSEENKAKLKRKKQRYNEEKQRKRQLQEEQEEKEKEKEQKQKQTTNDESGYKIHPHPFHSQKSSFLNNNNSLHRQKEDVTIDDDKFESFDESQHSRFGKVSTSGNDFALTPSRFEAEGGSPRVASIALQRSLEKRRFKLVHQSRRAPMQVDDESVQMSLDQVLKKSDVLSGSCFMLDASAVETALSGESLQQQGSSFYANSAWQDRMNQIITPPANSPVFIRESATKAQPLVNSERRLLFLYAMIRRFNETVSNIGLYRKILSERDLEKAKNKMNQKKVSSMNNGNSNNNNKKKQEQDIVLLGSDERGDLMEHQQHQREGENENEQQQQPQDVEEEEVEDPVLIQKKWAFDEYDRGSRLNEFFGDAKAVMEEIKFKKHLDYLENGGWWLTIPTNSSSTTFKSGAFYRCRIGSSTFMSLVHCWASLLGVRLADPDFIAESQGKSSAKERQQIANAVEFLETIFSREMDPQNMFLALDLGSLRHAFELLRHAFIESTTRYRHLKEKLQNIVNLAHDSESRLDMAVAGFSLALKEQFNCHFATALVARVEDVSLFRERLQFALSEKDRDHHRQQQQRRMKILLGSGGSSVTPFSVILPPNHPLRSSLLNVELLRNRFLERKMSVMLPFWIDVGGMSICESERHIDSIFGVLTGTTPWSLAPTTVATEDSDFTFVGSRQSCSSNNLLTHHQHNRLLHQNQVSSQKSGGVSSSSSSSSPPLSSTSVEDSSSSSSSSSFLTPKKRKRRMSNNNDNIFGDFDDDDDSPAAKAARKNEILEYEWCSASCSHPAGHSYYEANSVPAHIFPFTSSHTHAITIITGHADVLATQLSVHSGILQAFVPFSLSWILGRSASTAVLLSGMEQYRLSHGSIRFALCFTHWCSEMMQRYADDTRAIFRVTYPYVPVSLFNPSEVKEMFGINSNSNSNNNTQQLVILPGGIYLTKSNKMNDMSSMCSIPSASIEELSKNRCNSKMPFVIGAPIPWEKGNATRALESIRRLIHVVENVKFVSFCKIQVVVLLLHAPAMAKIESVVQPLLDQLSSAESKARISVCIFSTEGVKWNDHDTADFLGSSSIIVHPLAPTGWPHLAIQSLLLAKPVILPHCCGLSEIVSTDEAFFAEITGADVEHRELVNAVGENIIVRHWNFHVNLTQVTEYIEMLQKNSFLRWSVSRRGHKQAVRKAAGIDPHTIYKTMKFVAAQMEGIVTGSVEYASLRAHVGVPPDVVRRVLGMQDDRYQLS